MTEADIEPVIGVGQLDRSCCRSKEGGWSGVKTSSIFSISTSTDLLDSSFSFRLYLHDIDV